MLKSELELHFARSVDVVPSKLVSICFSSDINQERKTSGGDHRDLNIGRVSVRD